MLESCQYSIPGSMKTSLAKRKLENVTELSNFLTLSKFNNIFELVEREEVALLIRTERTLSKDLY